MVAAVRMATVLFAIALLYPSFLGATTNDNPPPFSGLRSLAMGGAHRGLANTNDALALNPAGLASGSRYAIETNYGRNAHSGGKQLGITAVDSRSGPIAAGFGYSMLYGGKGDSGDDKRHWFQFGSAIKISQALSIGVTGKHLRGPSCDGGDDTTGCNDDSVTSADAGVLLTFGERLSVGLSYHNIVAKNGDDADLVAGEVAGGVGLSFSRLVLAADVEKPLRDDSNQQPRYRLGAEYFIDRATVLRAGYGIWQEAVGSDQWRREQAISAGLGFYSQTGGVAISYNRSVRHSRRWQLLMGFEFFV